ncbi:hypothetical protein [Primorskyibacter sp. S187A]|uniref:hypothetical protein n=1 Tax=Primorskyibacter sp. S187A TaxID=3415130 RepID=UPI003C7ACC20
MRSLVLAALIALTGPGGAAMAMSARMTTEALVETSSLIIVGTYERTATADDGRTYGIITATDVLAGEAPEQIRLAIPQPGQPINSSMALHDVGQSGLWFLKRLKSGAYSANHPQRFLASDRAGALIQEVEALVGQ